MSVEATHPHKKIIDRFSILTREMRQEATCGKRDAEIFIFEVFRMVALLNDIDVLNAIWTHFPTSVWSCASGHVVQDLYEEEMIGTLNEFALKRRFIMGGKWQYQTLSQTDPRLNVTFDD